MSLELSIEVSDNHAATEDNDDYKFGLGELPVTARSVLYSFLNVHDLLALSHVDKTTNGQVSDVLYTLSKGNPRARSLQIPRFRADLMLQQIKLLFRAVRDYAAPTSHFQRGWTTIEFTIPPQPLALEDLSDYSESYDTLSHGEFALNPASAASLPGILADPGFATSISLVLGSKAISVAKQLAMCIPHFVYSFEPDATQWTRWGDDLFDSISMVMKSTPEKISLLAKLFKNGGIAVPRGLDDTEISSGADPFEVARLESHVRANSMLTCSDSNLQHFKTLAAVHGDEIAIVIMSDLFDGGFMAKFPPNLAQIIVDTVTAAASTGTIPASLAIKSCERKLDAQRVGNFDRAALRELSIELGSIESRL
jgi:hypothetical protein